MAIDSLLSRGATCAAESVERNFKRCRADHCVMIPKLSYDNAATDTSTGGASGLMADIGRLYQFDPGSYLLFEVFKLWIHRNYFLVL